MPWRGRGLEVSCGEESDGVRQASTWGLSKIWGSVTERVQVRGLHPESDQPGFKSQLSYTGDLGGFI